MWLGAHFWGWGCLCFGCGVVVALLRGRRGGLIGGIGGGSGCVSSGLFVRFCFWFAGVWYSGCE